MSKPMRKAANGTALRDLRSSLRRDFPYVQQAAPMVGGQMPSADKFKPIRCQDLSVGGIAVVMDAPPDFEHLVFALGVPPAVNHVTARVVRTERIERKGRTRYVVGCKFLRRVQL
jgi:hypothetical protein